MAWAYIYEFGRDAASNVRCDIYWLRNKSRLKYDNDEVSKLHHSGATTFCLNERKMSNLDL